MFEIQERLVSVLNCVLQQLKIIDSSILKSIIELGDIKHNTKDLNMLLKLIDDSIQENSEVTEETNELLQDLQNKLVTELKLLRHSVDKTNADLSAHLKKVIEGLGIIDGDIVALIDNLKKVLAVLNLMDNKLGAIKDNIGKTNEFLENLLDVTNKVLDFSEQAVTELKGVHTIVKKSDVTLTDISDKLRDLSIIKSTLQYVKLGIDGVVSTINVTNQLIKEQIASTVSVKTSVDALTKWLDNLENNTQNALIELRKLSDNRTPLQEIVEAKKRVFTDFKKLSFVVYQGKASVKVGSHGAIIEYPLEGDNATVVSACWDLEDNTTDLIEIDATNGKVFVTTVK